MESLFKGAATVPSNREWAHSLLFLVNAWEVASSFHNLLMQDTYPQSIALHKRQFYRRILNLPEALLSQPQNSKSLEKNNNLEPADVFVYSSHLIANSLGI